MSGAFFPTPPSKRADDNVWEAYTQAVLRWLVSNVERTETRGVSLTAQWERPLQAQVLKAEAFFCVDCDQLHVGLTTFTIEENGDLDVLSEENIDPATVR